MSKSTFSVGIAAVLLFASGVVRAQDAWSTRAEAGFVAAHGNGDTETANAKVEIVREVNKWKYTLGTSGLYGRSGGITSAQHFDGRLQTDHAFGERSFWFGAVRYEDDRFSGFDYQTTATTGLGHKFVDTDATKLSIQIGAGFRALRPEAIVRDPITGEVVSRVLGERSQDGVVNGALTFSHAFNDHTKLLDSLLTEAGQANTLTRNDLSLEVKMVKTFAVSLGYSIRHNTEPGPGLTRTDTLTTVNLVYLKANQP
jgi:putative salt-induced outer membrane protein